MPNATALAIEGGNPAVPADVHVAWPDVTEDDRLLALKVIDAPVKDLGNPNSRILREFEVRFAEFSGREHCVALSSGTAALLAGLVAAGVKPGDKVVVPALTFATAHAVLAAQAIPVWCDIDPRTFNLDVNLLPGLVDEQTTAIMAVHLHGLPVDMKPLMEFAKARGLKVIEDVAHAVGATYDEQATGTFGDGAAYSFHGQKLPQGSDGGAFTCDDPEIALAVRMFAYYGEELPVLKPGEVATHWSRWFGFNLRMHPSAANWVLPQLPRVPRYVETAQDNAEILIKGIQDIPGFVPPHIPLDRTSSHHLVRILLDPEALGWEGEVTELRDRLVQALQKEGVHAGYWLTHPQPKNPVFRRGGPVAWSPGAVDEPLEPYRAADYAVTQHVLDSSIVIGRAPHPLQVQPSKVAEHYNNAFEKVAENMDAIFSMPFTAPRFVPAISDN
ncbi:aminotransferase class I/II-fold pyridoxal phosphate-dependent enzyme [Kribbella antibiotica]|uniref:Aminotransferase class I/II-fold pyridoxal phosphate-dependent enzyme n=1 Tax=Kribbella antibiotica TaxID=190195 RepID=A0A4R4ZTW8_9ACTN|nr:aminotransferase class I/II-fold pyridoxal phosphate-dependent enzyme [Kribbella antibiotica]TDD61900.1 aminotransferase class I/II-fold pyridoxal phosphate-dependent enzyme [Kribbella antibiotica]